MLYNTVLCYNKTNFQYNQKVIDIFLMYDYDVFFHQTDFDK